MCVSVGDILHVFDILKRTAINCKRNERYRSPIMHCAPVGSQQPLRLCLFPWERSYVQPHALTEHSLYGKKRRSAVNDTGERTTERWVLCLIKQQLKRRDESVEAFTVHWTFASQTKPSILKTQKLNNLPKFLSHVLASQVSYFIIHKWSWMALLWYLLTLNSFLGVRLPRS